MIPEEKAFEFLAKNQEMQGKYNLVFVSSKALFPSPSLFLFVYSLWRACF
jgi:hypothetical protein